MTEDQKVISLVLESLNASRGIPRTITWLAEELRLAGRRPEVPSILDTMENCKLISSARDAIGIKRFSLTPAGKAALEAI